jgi:hypothetical protein
VHRFGRLTTSEGNDNSGNSSSELVSDFQGWESGLSSIQEEERKACSELSQTFEEK